MNEIEFQKWKQKFILNHLADNIYFCAFVENKSKSDPKKPELSIWTTQPINALKTQNHL